MTTRRAILIATITTAFMSLTLPAHAGSTSISGARSIVTAQQCMDGGGMVVDDVCQGGDLNGADVTF